MIRIMIALGLFIPFGAYAMSQRAELDMLNARIVSLEKQYAEKYDQLTTCEKQTKNFKIAGIATLAATGVGLYVNTKLHEKLNKLNNSTSGGMKQQVLSISAAEQCANFCKDEPEICAAPDFTCDE